MQQRTKDASHQQYTTIDYPQLRRGLALMYRSVQRTHKTYGLIEVDVTDARQRLRALGAQAGEHISFTAYILHCLAHTIDQDKLLHACHQGRRKLVLYDQVDIAVTIERAIHGTNQPIIAIIRHANTQSLYEIHQAIRAAQALPTATVWEGFSAERWLRFIPMVGLQIIWSIFWWLRGRYPHIQKQYGGTVGLTAIGMFGQGGGWAIPMGYHALDIALGGLVTKPVVRDGEIVIREMLCMTLSFDHDIIDGAPAARFVARLREAIEQGAGIATDPILQR